MTNKPAVKGDWHVKVRRSEKERRRAYVERFPCGYCLATPGSPCHFGPVDPEGEHNGIVYHVSRYKKAAGAAIDEALKREGVRYDEDGAIDEAEVRLTEPEIRK